jgi:hypothetical protein
MVTQDLPGGIPRTKSLIDKFRDWIQIGIPSDIRHDPNYPGNRIQNPKFYERPQGHLRFAGWSVAASDFAIGRNFKEARRSLLQYKQWKVQKCWEAVQNKDREMSKLYGHSTSCFAEAECSWEEFKPLMDELDRVLKECGQSNECH